MANVKLGNDTLTGVNKVKLQDADNVGQYVEFSSFSLPERCVILATNDDMSGANVLLGGHWVDPVYEQYYDSGHHVRIYDLGSNTTFGVSVDHGEATCSYVNWDNLVTQTGSGSGAGAPTVQFTAPAGIPVFMVTAPYED